MFWKLVSRAESVLLVVPDELVEPPLAPELDDVNSEIRLCRLAASPDGPPLIPDAALNVVPDVVAEVVPDVESVLLLCAWSAAIRLCKKLPIA